jgi:two-component system, response regulator YesN
VLRAIRAHVVPAVNIEEAERQITVARPDLIVCDMQLPDGTGPTFMRWVRGQRHGGTIPAIAITGWATHFPASSAGGFDAYMRKPLDLEKFATIAVVLAQR